MPLFFFHLRTPAGVRPDEAGVEYEDLEQAFLGACDAIPGVAGDLLCAGLNPMRCAFEVTGADGMSLMEVPFTELVREHPDLSGLQITSLQPLTRAERTSDLAMMVQQEVAMVREQVRAARAWVEGIRKAARPPGRP